MTKFRQSGDEISSYSGLKAYTQNGVSLILAERVEWTPSLERKLLDAVLPTESP